MSSVSPLTKVYNGTIPSRICTSVLEVMSGADGMFDKYDQRRMNAARRT